MKDATNLTQKHCIPCEGGTPPLSVENEEHHPDIYIFYNKVQLDLFTHAVGGLSENDFIMAAKIDSILDT